MRRGLAATTAVVLVLEAFVIAFVHVVLGLAVRNQNMSVAGLDSDGMAIGTWVGGALFGLFLIGCALIPARVALRGRPPGRFGQILLIVCAVVHGLLGALVVGLVGWAAFVFMMLVMALLVGTLLLYPDTEDSAPAAENKGNEVPPPTAPAAA
ncbi:hypothetical protein ACIGXA_03870 [Streptomyces fildesensis]|uniref:Integral membrane protein n=1 Tax=Streptomyces fildesensis TaxID=375757 RepID=A0ABW8BZN9_9ACTN